MDGTAALRSAAARGPLAVLGVALAARLLCIAWTASGWHVLPPNHLVLGYFEQGAQLAAGRGYLDVDAPAPVPEMLHPPGMAILVAGFRLLLGGSGHLPVQLLGALLDAAAAAALCVLAARWLSPRAGLLAGLAYALWPPAVWAAAGSRTPEGLMPLPVLVALACALRAAQAPGRRSWAWAAACGAAVGLSAYLRPDYLLLPVALGAGIWAWTRRPGRAAAVASAAQLAALLVLLPWAWRNHELSGRWIFTSTSVGGTLITGLGEFRNAWGFGYTDEDRRAEALARGFDSPWSPEADAHFREVFRRAVAERPGEYLRSVVRRLPLAVAAPQSFGLDNPWKTQTFTEARAGGRDRFDVLRERPLYVALAYGDVLLVALLNVLAFCACAALLAAGPGGRGLVLLLLSPHLYGMGTHLLTHLEPRFILPSAFVLAMGLGWAVERLAARRARARA